MLRTYLAPRRFHSRIGPLPVADPLGCVSPCVNNILSDMGAAMRVLERGRGCAGSHPQRRSQLVQTSDLPSPEVAVSEAGTKVYPHAATACLK